MYKAAERAEHKNVVVREEAAFAEVETPLEVDGLEIAIEIVTIIPTIGRDVGIGVASEPLSPRRVPTQQG